MVCFDTRMSQEVKSSRGGASEEFELKLWQSILSESQPVTGRDDVFQWRGVSLNVVYVFQRRLCLSMSSNVISLFQRHLSLSMSSVSLRVFQWRGVSLNVVYVFPCPFMSFHVVYVVYVFPCRLCGYKSFNRELCVDMSVCVRVHAYMYDSLSQDVIMSAMIPVLIMTAMLSYVYVVVPSYVYVVVPSYVYVVVPWSSYLSLRLCLCVCVCVKTKCVCV